eukprot:scaffold82873_cov59-Phaeocystis_antarctica.AAC.1
MESTGVGGVGDAGGELDDDARVEAVEPARLEAEVGGEHELEDDDEEDGHVDDEAREEPQQHAPADGDDERHDDAEDGHNGHRVEDAVVRADDHLDPGSELRRGGAVARLEVFRQVVDLRALLDLVRARRGAQRAVCRGGAVGAGLPRGRLVGPVFEHRARQSAAERRFERVERGVCALRRDAEVRVLPRPAGGDREAAAEDLLRAVDVGEGGHHRGVVSRIRVAAAAVGRRRAERDALRAAGCADACDAVEEVLPNGEYGCATREAAARALGQSCGAPRSCGAFDVRRLLGELVSVLDDVVVEVGIDDLGHLLGVRAGLVRVRVRVGVR